MNLKSLRIIDFIKQNFYLFNSLVLLYAFILGGSLLSGYYRTFNINIFNYLGLWEIIFRTLYMLVVILVISAVLLFIHTIVFIFISPQVFNFRKRFDELFLIFMTILFIALPFCLFDYGNHFAKNIYDNKSYLYSSIKTQGKLQTFKLIGYVNGQNFFTDLSNEIILIVPNSGVIELHKFDSDKLKKTNRNHIFNI